MEKRLGCLKAFRSILILLQESFALPLASNTTLVLPIMTGALASLVELTLSIKRSLIVIIIFCLIPVPV
jgi:hypothetical protein